MSHSFRSWLAAGVLLVLTAFNASAAEIRVPATEARAGQALTIPIKVDRLENLAGLKFVILYDAAILEYQTSEKTEFTASLMHVVNDKKPGRLVIVMAGAKGIGGQNMDLVHLSFRVKQLPDTINQKIQTRLSMPEIEMMSDQLVPLDCTIQIEPIQITP